jgi:hypothetical protein
VVKPPSPCRNFAGINDSLTLFRRNSAHVVLRAASPEIFMTSRASALKAMLLASGIMFMAAPASAQWFASAYRPPVIMDELSPREVMQVAARHGFSQISRPVYGDDFAVVSATDRQGRRAKVMIDSFSGRMLRTMPMAGGADVRRDAPKPREQVAQVRSPAVAPAVRQAVPDAPTQTRATPDKPTIVRREPMLPAQPMTQNPKAGATVVAPVPPTSPQTAAQPRRIGMVPPAELDAPPTAPRAPAGAPFNSVPVAPLD